MPSRERARLESGWPVGWPRSRGSITSGVLPNRHRSQIPQTNPALRHPERSRSSGEARDLPIHRCRGSSVT